MECSIKFNGISSKLKVTSEINITLCGIIGSVRLQKLYYACVCNGDFCMM